MEKSKEAEVVHPTIDRGPMYASPVSYALREVEVMIINISDSIDRLEETCGIPSETVDQQITMLKMRANELDDRRRAIWGRIAKTSGIN